MRDGSLLPVTSIASAKNSDTRNGEEMLKTLWLCEGKGQDEDMSYFPISHAGKKVFDHRIEENVLWGHQSTPRNASFLSCHIDLHPELLLKILFSCDLLTLWQTVMNWHK